MEKEGCGKKSDNKKSAYKSALFILTGRNHSGQLMRQIVLTLGKSLGCNCHNVDIGDLRCGSHQCTQIQFLGT